MMLVLAVRSEPERVYQRALRYFTPDELSEAFAATRGVASPTQLRAFMKRYPRDVLAVFRALAPPRKPIVLQRWSLRRVGLALRGAPGHRLVAVHRRPVAPSSPPRTSGRTRRVRHGIPLILAAQAVPSAAQVPCVAELPSGWQVERRRHRQRPLRILAGFRPGRPSGRDRHPVRGLRRFRCPGDPLRRAGHAALRRARRAWAPVHRAALSTPSPAAVPPTGSISPPARPRSSRSPVDAAVAFMPRAALVDYVRDNEGLALCGRGAPCPG